HRFAEAGNHIMLGGVRIEHHVGLVAHSDGDVLLHAISDGYLGALAWGDIGHWFPDTDATYKGADSSKLHAEIVNAARAEGWILNNLDATVVAERPKLQRHVPTIRQSIADLCNASIDQVSVKATTSEKMGFVGREEGIAVHAVVSLIMP
ncbi:MAG: 2-C-methyl-D-erythritol 2,4-cyclodiphosphate synthase, partial [Gammaproteobacteria bacterium]|nr:2-C-methyl-D-erythritol 2,4-cyclodiphosphate synthase [Gammaproteobacteria bacterium]